jgi:hypothetical protein
MKRVKTLNEKALLEKNPKAAKILQSNRKKLQGGRRRPPKEYGLGLPYARPALVSMTDADDEASVSNSG